MGILFILAEFIEELKIDSLNWYWWALGAFGAVVILLFTILGCKRRKIWNMHQEMIKYQGEIFGV